MDRTLIKDFWGCGDNDIIDCALIRARLNHNEHMALSLILDECKTQEQAAEILDVSTRCFQNLWYSATDKILNIPWALAYAEYVRKHS